VIRDKQMTDSSPPLFSIIIPAYNLEGYIGDCLQSIQAQTFPDFEVLIVDDGSTDGTAQVAKEFAKSDSRFRLYQKDNGGVSSARNLGLDLANGEFVWFIDGDDYIHPESLSWLKGLFESYPEADYVSFAYDWTKKSYNGRFPPLEPIEQVSIQYFDCATKEGFENTLRFSPIAVCCVCYRRKLAQGYRFQKIKTCEDRLFALEMSLKARAVVRTEVKIYRYFQRGGSATHAVTRGFMLDRFRFMESLLALGKEEEGRIDGFLNFMFSTEIFPCTMRDLVKMPNKQERTIIFEKLLEMMERVRAAFPGNTSYSHIDRVLENKNFGAAWMYLVLRFEPRRFLGRNPGFLRVYRWLRPGLKFTR